MNTKEVETIRDRIKQILVQEIQSTNVVAQQTNPEEFLPRFIENATQSLHELVINELVYKRRLH